MSRKVKCSQCKYLKTPNSELEKEHLTDMVKNECARKGIDPFEWLNPDEINILFNCEADKNWIPNDFAIDQPRDCKFFRSNTLTAWQEVEQEIWQKIKGLNPISMIRYILNR